MMMMMLLLFRASFVGLVRVFAGRSQACEHVLCCGRGVLGRSLDGVVHWEQGEMMLRWLWCSSVSVVVCRRGCVHRFVCRGVSMRGVGFRCVGWCWLLLLLVVAAGIGVCVQMLVRTCSPAQRLARRLNAGTPAQAFTKTFEYIGP